MVELLVGQVVLGVATVQVDVVPSLVGLGAAEAQVLLAQLDAEDAVAPLMRAWRNDPSADVQRAAAASLAELGAPTAAVFARALAVPSLPKREEMLDVLGAMRAPESILVLCEEYLRHQTEQVLALIQDKRAALGERPEHGPFREAVDRVLGSSSD